MLRYIPERLQCSEVDSTHSARLSIDFESHIERSTSGTHNRERPSYICSDLDCIKSFTSRVSSPLSKAPLTHEVSDLNVCASCFCSRVVPRCQQPQASKIPNYVWDLRSFSLFMNIRSAGNSPQSFEENERLTEPRFCLILWRPDTNAMSTARFLSLASMWLSS